MRFEVKSKRDRKSYLVRDRIFNLIWSTIENNNNNNNNRFIVQVISNIEQDYWHISMLARSSSYDTIIHFEGTRITNYYYLILKIMQRNYLLSNKQRMVSANKEYQIRFYSQRTNLENIFSLNTKNTVLGNVKNNLLHEFCLVRIG